MKVAILGFGKQGQSNYRYYAAKAAQITICDQQTELADAPKAVKLQLGKDYLANLSGFDLLVRTSYLNPNKITAANPDDKDILAKVTTASKEFFHQVKTPIIAVTGTKGKGTSCYLSQAILEAAGLRVCLVGNIGIPPLDVVTEARQADVVVFEIASCQTMDLDRSPAVGVCLKMSPEHLDWHDDYQDYLNCKAQLFANQKPQDKAIYAFDNAASWQVVSKSSGRQLGYATYDEPQAYIFIKDEQIWIEGQPIAKVGDIRLLGKHSQQNVCAAIAAVFDFLPAGSARQAIAKALDKCRGFTSRLEPIAEINQVTYINDSFASAPPASIAALEAIAGPIVLIAGGHDKGVKMDDFANKIATSNVKHLITIGTTGPTIADLVADKNPKIAISRDLKTMPEIVAEASARASAGDTVLLSTACASWDMFDNFADRAEKFKQAVSNLNSNN